MDYLTTLCIAGKNDIAVNILDYIAKNIRNVDLCFTSDRTDTGIDTWQKSAKKYARINGIKEVELDDLYTKDNLIFLSLEYDRIINPDKFKTDRLYNVHFSLLPKYKGMYTSIWPILNGEKESGVTLHIIRRGIDTGEIIDQDRININYDMNSYQLYTQYIDLGTSLIKKNIKKLISNDFNSIPQSKADSTYYSKSSINFNRIKLDVNATANQIHNQIRAFAFKPYQLLQYNGKRLLSSKITDSTSTYPTGTILKATTNSFTMATVDYDIIVMTENER